jgi:methanogenic corrinoid protein MtbC1
VSPSTVKRWVDSGTIRAVRTVGKHRLIPMSEALRLAREQGVHAAKIEVLAGLGPTPLDKVDPRVCDLLFNLLRENKARQAKTLIQSVYSAGAGAAVLADELIRPVMERVGHGWMMGSLDVFQEHQSTLTITAAIRELIDRQTVDEAGHQPLALGAAAEGDPYFLSTLLGELLLREQGWEVHNLGANLPLRSLANATRLYKPKLIFITVNFLKDEEAFVREYLSFYDVASATNTAVILGGRALGPQLRAQLLYASFGDRMGHLAEFARRVLNHNPPSSPEDEKRDE